MKNYYKLTKALVALAVLGTAKLNAQVATMYSFSQQSGVYTPITTGGTVFGSSTTDDDSWADPTQPNSWYNQGPGVEIGFSFMYNNISFDRVGICANGYISLGKSSLNPGVDIWGGYTCIENGNPSNPILGNCIGGLSRDLQARPNASVRAVTIGTSPTRTFVVQWDNYQQYSGYMSVSDDTLNFQIKLCETTNIVEIQYGKFHTDATPYSSPANNAEVGLRGSSNSDFNNRVVNTTNNWANSIAGVNNYDKVNWNTSGLIPNVGQIYRWTPPQCSGALTSLSSTGDHTMVCPNGSAVLSLVNSYSVSGIVYSWAYSTNSAVGPFTVIPNTNGAEYPSLPITAPSWFMNTATCLNGGAPTTSSTAWGIQVAATTVSTVPYYEDFEGVISNNELPNCSWYANNTPNVTQTYINSQSQNRVARSGTKFAAFVAAYTSGSNYFYTNGLQLNAGVTYSASMWYTTDFYGHSNVSSLSLMYGTTQTPSGLVTIASHSPAVAPVYKALGGTFQVPSSGIYYIAVEAQTNGNYGTPYLSWDDLEVIVPCSLNSSTVTLNASAQTLCQGDEINLTASGADSYTWSTGATGSAVTDIPVMNTIYSVYGTNQLSGCTVTVQSQLVTVNPSPNLFAYSTNPLVCSGQVVNLVGAGADSYTWSTGSNNALISVTPTLSTDYIVIGGNSFGCTRSQTVTVQVSPLPNVTVQGPTDICKGETAILTGGGASNYEFASNSSFIQGQQASVNPNVTTTYTVTGTNTVGCSNKTTVTLNVNECTGINEITTTLSGVNVYPNPTSGVFTVELKNTFAKTVQITDLTGRVIMTNTSNNEKINMNINNLANGIYYVKIQSNNAVEVIKIIKN